MALAATALVVAGWYPIDNPDTFGHLAAGRQIAELGHVPSHDSFSFFREQAQPWVNYEWLSALTFYGAYALGGDLGLSALRAMLLALLGVVLVRRAYEREGWLGAMLTALLLVLATAACRYRFSVRPQLFGLLLSGVYLLLLTRLVDATQGAARKPWRWVLALGGLHVLWVNLHGSHLLGLLMSVTFCVLCIR
jgi:hypothetical protein